MYEIFRALISALFWGGLLITFTTLIVLFAFAPYFVAGWLGAKLFGG